MTASLQPRLPLNMQFFKRQKATSADVPPSTSHSTQPSIHKDDDSEKRAADTLDKSGTHLAVTSPSPTRQLSTDSTDSSGHPQVPANEATLEKRIEGIEADVDEPAADGTVYPKGMKLAAITAALMLSVFCMALDNTIISTAIPKITDQFKAIDDVGWYGSSYLLTTCAFQLFFGKLYTFFSIKWVYMVALIIFEIGSAVCGAAPDSMSLIVGRAVAGVGSAGIFSGAILIVANTVPLSKRPMYTGLIGAMYGLAR